MQKPIYKILFALAAIIFLGCAGFLGYRFISSQSQKLTEQRLREEVESTTEIDLDTLKNMEFSGERDGEGSEIPEGVFNKDSAKKIDFEKLQSYNEELIAWIYVNGTEISYPIARHEGEDQEYYLNYDMYQEVSYSGCIYMENINKADFTDNNTVIYGHNMRNGTMFKGLHRFEEKEFFDKNKYIFIYLPDKTLVYEIFAAYVANDENILANHDFTKKKVYKKYLEDVTNPDYVDGFVRKNVKVTTDDKIITLSTCIGGQTEERYLVQGVLKYTQEQ